MEQSRRIQHSLHLCVFVMLVLVGAFVSGVNGTHFRGGTINWKAEGATKVHFFYRLGWTYGNGPGCTSGQIGKYVTGMSADHWECMEGLCGQPYLHDVNYICRGADPVQDWEQGTNDFTHIFPNSGPLTIGFSSGDWIQLSNGKGNGNWNLQTTVDLRARSDTKAPNSSPESQSKPMYFVAFNCEAKLTIPVIDPDNDNVRCRWAKNKECESVCDALPHAHLDEDTCTLEFNATQYNKYQANGVYAVALTIEDFPAGTITLDGNTTKTPKEALSSIPLQFLVEVIKEEGPCDSGPRFVSPTPEEGDVITVEVKDKLEVGLFADDGDGVTSTKADDITVSGPLTLKQSPVIPDVNRTNTYTTTLTWRPTHDEIGNHIVCASVTNEHGRIGRQRCFTVEVVAKGCQISPCQNNGKCVANNYMCVCRPGFTGHDCEVNIDDCVSKTCPEGTHCVDGISSYTCANNTDIVDTKPECTCD